MSVIKKLVTLLRGSVREIGDSVVDANSARIYEQEIVDAKHHIEQARGELTAVMAKEMQSAREIDRLRREVERTEALAIEALDKSKEGLAEEVAAKGIAWRRAVPAIAILVYGLLKLATWKLARVEVLYGTE